VGDVVENEAGDEEVDVQLGEGGDVGAELPAEQGADADQQQDGGEDGEKDVGGQREQERKVKGKGKKVKGGWCPAVGVREHCAGDGVDWLGGVR
jgi:hypothetical protein